MRALTINLRNDQYTQLERVAVERGHEGKMSKAMRAIFDEWVEADKKRLDRKIRKEHDKADG